MCENNFFLVGNDGETDAETVALLKYMLDHNRQHAIELAEIAEKLDNGAKEFVLSAVGDFERGNEKLMKALNEINK